MAVMHLCDCCSRASKEECPYRLETTNKENVSLGFGVHQYDVCATCFQEIFKMLNKPKGKIEVQL